MDEQKGHCGKSYRFTASQDWFSTHIPTWTTLFPLITTSAPRILEIGTWEGRSAVFLLTQLCATGGELVSIDHFDLMRTPEGRERYKKVIHNLALTGKSYRILSQFSIPALYALLQEELVSQNPGYDFIYIDGSHDSDDTFLDGELAWRLAKNGAIFIFDDYKWPSEPPESRHHPKRGIDGFMTLHIGEYEVLSRPDCYQMILRKVSDMRVGFSMAIPREIPKAGDCIDVALGIDSAYLMPAAVAIRSAADKTKGPITFYVVSYGLVEADKQRIKDSMPNRSNISLLFLDLPESSLARELGPVWTKIDLMKVLNVERALYLDADALVIGDLRELWDIDLEGKSVGAAPDVGHPRGHSGTNKVPYFNAGVLLLDLKVIRGRYEELDTLAKEMKESVFRDQDVLNRFFQTDWKPLSLKWNAQGLGTYAEYFSPERQELPLEDLKQPAIVHFTGPVNPSLPVVLNPWVQPYTAKPWGYAGAPGHPHKEEWWTTLEKTAWKGWRNSEERMQLCVSQETKIIEDATAELKKRSCLGRVSQCDNAVMTLANLLHGAKSCTA